MSRLPNTRFALARVFANLTIMALPKNERFCLDAAFSLADLLLNRAVTIRKMWQDWNASGRDGE